MHSKFPASCFILMLSYIWWNSWVLVSLKSLLIFLKLPKGVAKNKQTKKNTMKEHQSVAFSKDIIDMG